MPTLTVEYQTEAERLFLEQALAFFTQLRQVAGSAPDGAVLDACEQVALADGRKLVRDALGAAVQQRADATDAEKKSATATRADAGAGS
jgi:hypothetical protein